MGFCGKRGLSRFFASKKAEESMLYELLIALVFVGVLALFYFNFINSLVNNSLYERNYYARDSALMTSVMYASPGDVSYTYGISPLNEYDFFMTLNDSTTVIKDASHQDVEYIYPDDAKFKNPKLAFSTKNIENILFDKSKRSLEVKEQQVNK